MEDFIEILKTILAVIGVVFFIILGTLLYASDKTEDTYQSAKVNMDKGNWDAAIKEFEQIPNYKETTDLYFYSYPHKLYYADYKAIDDEIIGYKQTISYIQQNLSMFKGTSKLQYQGDLKELEKVINFKITELNVKKINDITKKDYEDSISFIKQGKYQEALVKLQNIKDDSVYGVEKKHLIGYINILNVTRPVGQNPENITKEVRNSVIQLVSSMNPYYTGPFAQDIQKIVQPYIDSEKWLEAYLKTVNNEQDVQKTKISQGMKKWELTLAQGNPASEYKISNKYGTFERLTFHEGKVVYLENGIVTAVNN